MATRAPNPPADHHYLPAFYQRGWAGDDGCVERFTRVHGKVVVKRKPPTAAGFQRDLYRNPFANDERAAQALESEFFADLDDRAAKALAVLLASKLPPRNERVRADWTQFVRSMMHRTPTHMSATLQKYVEIWNTPSEALQRKYEGMKRPGYPATAEQFLEALNPNAAEEAAFKLLSDAMKPNKLSKHISRLAWRIIDCSSADRKLLLSDTPVILVPLALTNGHLAMPLSPTKVLLMAKRVQTRRQIARMDRDAVVRAINNLVVERAYHCVIAADREDEDLIRRTFGTKPVGSLANGFNP